MTIRIAKRIEKFPEYVFSRLAKEVAEVEKKSGRKVLNLGMGIPDVKPSAKYVEKLVEFITAKDSHIYPGYGAILEFTKALQEWYLSRFKVSLSSDEIFPLLGAKDATGHLPLALLDVGDELLVPDPGYPGFSGPVTMIGAVSVPYTLSAENDFKIDIKELEQKVTRRTKGIYINFPSNPTGQVITKEELQPIVAFVKKHSIALLYDNAYCEVTFDGFVAPSILEIEGAKDVAIELGSFSKSFSFAGFRMGFVVGNKELISALAKVKSQVDSGLSLSFQRIGAYALSNPDEEWGNAMIRSYQERRDIIAKYLQTLGLSFTLPKGGLYIWAKIPDGAKDSETFARDLLHDKQILVTPGIAFGQAGDRFIRVSICTNIDKIADYF